ncbi:hypothetical protein [Streptococcus cuniculipharyngis]|uniref:Uncharacterized protein n=1 Tax=Streptococcus cuniculipharyngis TaxID=1562651 RepID=A0A5C5SBB6_9STRE|nr:hypothetical protein [Streptococcus cuniculipharyngis]TWS98177.1 hypothetical protein FRX57_04405 [Streptococcus cuniculipharyngis]
MLQWFQLNKWQKGLFLVAFMGLFSFVLCLPQVLTREVTMGADSIFHYNRFYETAMQIKERNFSYFISLYGYQQSGRIVNALYGPYFAYFQGLLVLLGKTWFGYHILSRTLIGLIAGSSLYFLMTKMRVRKCYALPLSLFFITTYAIQYWTILQGFSSWGTAFFPLGLLGAVDLLQQRRANWCLIALSMGMMLQVHVLSTLFLGIIYAVVGLYILLTSPDKLTFLKTISYAILLFLLLTVNVWLPLIQLNLTNELVQPYINKKFVQQTITGLDRGVLFAPATILVLMVGQLVHYVLFARKNSPVNRLLMGVYLLFLVLASGFFPWQYFAGKHIALVDLIQFPTRFFFYATPLLLLLVGLQLSQGKQTYQRAAVGLLTFCLAGGIYYTLTASRENITNNYRSDHFLETKAHTTLYGNSQEIRQAFHDQKLSRLLYLVRRSTPDYLPLIKKQTSLDGMRHLKESRYDLYEHYIILENDIFTKKVRGNSLILTWTTDVEAWINLPLAVYARSQLVFNGRLLKAKDYELSVIGTPSVKQVKGKNELILSYQNPWWLIPSLIISVLSWLGLCYHGMKFKTKNLPIANKML